MRFSKDVLALNPDLRAETRRASQKHEDVADVLYAELRRHAQDVWLVAQRDRPFETFRIDIAFPGRMVAVEVNGGLKRAGGGKHATSRDHQKVRRLVLAGWRVLIFTSSEVRADPLGCIADIRKALEMERCK